MLVQDLLRGAATHFLGRPFRVLTPGSSVHAADASVVRRPPTGLGLLFGRIGQKSGTMAEPSNTFIIGTYI